MLITSIIITPFFLLTWVLSFWWDRRRVVTHMMGTFWAWHYQSLIPFWKLSLTGRKKIPWSKPVIIVANHRSLVDILALYKIRRPFKWVSKRENFRLPFVGWVLALSKSIPIDRQNMRSGMQFIAKAQQSIKEGSSVIIFPEGTRSKSSAMKKFREGAFLLAKRMKVPIIPVVHIGTEKTFQSGKKSWILKGKATIKIKVLDKIPLDIIDALSIDELSDYIRKKMEEGLQELENK